jgi:hypothetical protein
MIDTWKEKSSVVYDEERKFWLQFGDPELIEVLSDRNERWMGREYIFGSRTTDRFIE